VLLEIRHLEGPKRGRAERLAGPRVRVGSDPGCELCLANAPGVLPLHAEITVEGSRAHLEPRGTVHLNGRPAGEATLRDGDLLAIGDEIRVRVRLVTDDQDRAREFDALLARTPAPATELPLSPARLLHGRRGAAVTVLFLAILVGGAYLAAQARPRTNDVEASLAQERSRQDALRAAQERSYRSRLQKLRGDIGSLERRMARRDEVDERVGEVQRAVAEVESNVLDRVDTEIKRSLGESPELRAARDAIRRIEHADAAAGRLIQTYSPSICLIQGAYGFGKVKDGKWRFLREATPDLLEGMPLKENRVPLVLEGDGSIFLVEYTGTGFLVDDDGIVLTNRHIAQPWWKNDAAAPLLDDGYTARFTSLRAYFPGLTEPVEFDLTRTVLSEEADLAALKFEPAGPLPRPLPLEQTDRVSPGTRVMLLGYPSGLDALLARTEEEFMAKGTELEPFEILNALAVRGFVRPLPTQGHVSDVLEDKILFDAATAVGGSGGPLLNMEGRVVAINYGILKAFRGANFGVPVSFASKLLQ
jgi:S1-C subfamily serine protease